MGITINWALAIVLGVLGALLEAFAVAFAATSRSSLSGTASLIAYALFLPAIPYLALTSTTRWWTSAVATLESAWILMIVLWIPAGFIGAWVSAAGSDTYYVVGGGLGRWLLFSGAGLVIVAVLTTVIGGLARLAFRSPAA
jgi:hypothetical protein